MNARTSLSSVLGGAALIAALAGGPISIAAAQMGEREHPARQPEHDAGKDTDHRTQGVCDFRSLKDATGASLYSVNGDELGSISDLIVDRGSGSIRYAVVKSGDFLGLGGAKTVIEFSGVRFDAGADRYVVSLSPEQIDRLPTFDAESWPGLGAEDVDLTQRDAYARAISDGERGTLKGRITDVARRSTESGEEIVVTMTTRDGATERVIFGPSWYVMGQDGAPMRGYDAEVDAVKLVRAEGPRYIATGANVNGQELMLRTDDAHPRWMLRSDAAPERSRRYALASDLIGADVSARGRSCGEVQDIYFEQGRGVLGFVVIDPNENFMGINDELKLVPWSIVQVRADTSMDVDASKEMVVNASKAPKAETLDTPADREAVYRAYAVEPVSFEKTTRTGDDEKIGDATNAERRLGDAIRKGERASINGEYVSTNRTRVADTEMTGIVIRTDGAPRLVLLGPAWFIERQKLAFSPGDKVELEAQRFQIDGETHYAACSLKDANGRTTELFSRDGSGAWKGNH